MDLIKNVKKNKTECGAITAFFTHRILADIPKIDYSDYHDPTYIEFKGFLKKVAEKQTFISSEEMVEAIRNGDSLKGTAHISLDDGFSSTLIAAEICIDLGIPLTVFVLTGPLDGYVPWFVLRTSALAAHSGIVRYQGESYDLRNMNQSTALHNDIKRAVYSVPSGEQLDTLRQILDECALPVPHDLNKFSFLSREDLLLLTASGVEIGSHGRTHCALPGESDTVLEREIDKSKAALENIIGQVRYFSYPDGAYDAKACERVTSAGYEAAFSVTTRAMPATTLTIPRCSFGRFRYYWNKDSGVV